MATARSAGQCLTHGVTGDPQDTRKGEGVRRILGGMEWGGGLAS